MQFVPDADPALPAWVSSEHCMPQHQNGHKAVTKENSSFEEQITVHPKYIFALCLNASSFAGKKWSKAANLSRQTGCFNVGTTSLLLHARTKTTHIIRPAKLQQTKLLQAILTPENHQSQNIHEMIMCVSWIFACLVLDTTSATTRGCSGLITSPSLRITQLQSRFLQNHYVLLLLLRSSMVCLPALWAWYLAIPINPSHLLSIFFFTLHLHLKVSNL